MRSNLNPASERINRTANRVIGGSMIFVSIRCTLQYVILPFVLPWFGLSGGLSVAISMVLETVALGMIVFNIVQLWNTSWRWRYLALSTVTVSMIGLFLYLDLRILFGA
jgi:hypothetical protein